LVQEGERLILIDNGIGDKQDEKFFNHYYLHGDDTLQKSLAKHGFGVDDITDVFLTHLHFDHCGGSILYNTTRDQLEPVFKNATYWSNENHWEWATAPNAREKASFLKENILPIKESGQLRFLKESEQIMFGFDVEYVYGHTDAMMLPKISYKDRTLLYMADLIPSAAHIPLPYIMAYDMRPLQTLSEKEIILKEIVDNNYTLFFEHDPVNECGTLQQTERGIRLDKTFKLSEWL
jgi:glyoxylase-like metal-dependent hydrolase (beta-lactamase superfamily II)